MKPVAGRSSKAQAGSPTKNSEKETIGYKLRQQLPRLMLRRPHQEPKKSEVHGYLLEAFSRLQEVERNLEANPRKRISIDGGYGDLSMSMFRRKDRNSRLHDIPILFTEEFRSRLGSYFPANVDTRRFIDEIIERNRDSTHHHTQLSTLENSPAKSKHIFEQANDLDGHLNYDFVNTNERGWLAKLQAEHSKSLEMRTMESHPSVEHKVSRNSLPLRSKHSRKGYMFKSLAFNRLC